MRQRYSKRRQEQIAELNITAFMNLMVILVPFLLITAVFTHLTVIELNLPTLTGNKQDNKNKNNFELHVTIREQALMLSDNRGGLIKRIPVSAQEHNYKLLTITLKQIKSRFPNKTSATILAETNTSYDTLVQVMDAVRMYTAWDEGQWVQAELFPDIAIGDAPS